MNMEKKFKRVHSFCLGSVPAKLATASAAAGQFFRNKGLNI